MMRTYPTITVLALALMTAGCGGSSGAQHATTPTTIRSTSAPAGYHPTIQPANFTASVTNAWFPLTPGSTYIYRGVKDGKPSRDIYTVAHQTAKINGVDCAVVNDQLYLAGHLEERTTDYYTQDRQGNVWYFGEDTAELNDKGRVTSTEGSWRTGKDGAQPGIFMQANPTVNASFRQEYYAGHAEDQYAVVNLASPVTVPYGSFTSALLTKEWTRLEPDVLDHKYYVKGVGEIAELSVRGPVERARLVSYHRG
jgi:hypothetical protein